MDRERFRANRRVTLVPQLPQLAAMPARAAQPSQFAQFANPTRCSRFRLARGRTYSQSASSDVAKRTAFGPVPSFHLTVRLPPKIQNEPLTKHQPKSFV